MNWWKQSKVPYNQREFCEIVNGYVFDCPAANRTKSKKGMQNSGPQQKIVYNDVSMRGCAFHSRGINGSLLNTILSQIKRKSMYASVDSSESVEKRISDLVRSSGMADKHYNIIVIKHRHNMPDTEAVFYYIRNAFAHGAFEVMQSASEPIYYLESKKNKEVCAQIRLKEKTLLEILLLSKMTPQEIVDLQRKKGPSKRQRLVG